MYSARSSRLTFGNQMRSNSTKKEFQSKQERFISLCLLISRVVLQTDYPYAKNVSAILSEAAGILVNSDSVIEKREAAGSVRHLFHKDGIGDWPGPKEHDSWDNDLNQLYDLSTIYAEIKYKEFFTEQDSGEGLG